MSRIVGVPVPTVPHQRLPAPHNVTDDFVYRGGGFRVPSRQQRYVSGCAAVCVAFTFSPRDPVDAERRPTKTECGRGTRTRARRGRAVPTTTAWHASPSAEQSPARTTRHTTARPNEPPRAGETTARARHQTAAHPRRDGMEAANAARARHSQATLPRCHTARASRVAAWRRCRGRRRGTRSFDPLTDSYENVCFHACTSPE